MLARAMRLLRSRVPGHRVRHRRARQLPARSCSRRSTSRASATSSHLPGFLPDDQLRDTRPPRRRASSSRRCTSRSASSPSRRSPAARRSSSPAPAGWPSSSTAPAPACCSSRATPTSWRRASRWCSPTPALADEMRKRGAELLAERYSWQAIAGATAASTPVTRRRRDELTRIRATASRARRRRSGYASRPCAPSAASRSRPPSRRRSPPCPSSPPTCTGRGTPRRPGCSPGSGRAGGPASPTRPRWCARTTADRLAELAADTGIINDLGAVVPPPADGAQGLDVVRRRATGSPLRPVAYFSPEFGISEAVPQYSGGLGVLAGDHLKASSDLGVPLVGVGLLYTEGYFRQRLDADGWQQESVADFTPPSLGLADTGVEVTVDLAGDPVDGPRLAGRRRAHPALPARHRRRGQLARRRRRHRPPVRRRRAPPPAPGDRARHRRRAGAAGARHRARRVPHERGPRRVPRPRAHPRAGRPAGCRSPPPSRPSAAAACSRPTPRCRPASTASPRADGGVLHVLRRGVRRHVRRAVRARPSATTSPTASSTWR